MRKNGTSKQLLSLLFLLSASVISALLITWYLIATYPPVTGYNKVMIESR